MYNMGSNIKKRPRETKIFQLGDNTTRWTSPGRSSARSFQIHVAGLPVFEEADKLSWETSPTLPICVTPGLQIKNCECAHKFVKN